MPSHTRPGANGEQNRRFERPAEKQFWMGGRAVDCDGLENRCGGNSTGGSNPSPSARNNQTPDKICRGFVFRQIPAAFPPQGYQYVQRSYQIIE